MFLSRLACRIGIGLAAGAAGTAAMSVSQAIDIRIRKRPASPTPAKAVEEVFGVHADDEDTEMRLANQTHWAYGTAWGLFLPVTDALGLKGISRTVAHTAALQGSAMTMLPRLDVAPPAKEWGAKEIAIEALHHAIYATAAGVAYAGAARALFGSRSQTAPRKGVRWWQPLIAGLGAALLSRLSHSGSGKAATAAGFAGGILARKAAAEAAVLTKDAALEHSSFLARTAQRLNLESLVRR